MIFLGVKPSPYDCHQITGRAVPFLANFNELSSVVKFTNMTKLINFSGCLACLGPCCEVRIFKGFGFLGVPMYWAKLHMNSEKSALKVAKLVWSGIIASKLISDLSRFLKQPGISWNRTMMDAVLLFVAEMFH